MKENSFECGIDCSEAETPKNVWDDRKSSRYVGDQKLV